MDSTDKAQARQAATGRYLRSTGDTIAVGHHRDEPRIGGQDQVSPNGVFQVDEQPKVPPSGGMPPGTMETLRGVASNPTYAPATVSVQCLDLRGPSNRASFNEVQVNPSPRQPGSPAIAPSSLRPALPRTPPRLAPR